MVRPFWILINTNELEFPVTTRTRDPILKAQRHLWSINIGGETNIKRAHIRGHLQFTYKTPDLNILCYCNKLIMYNIARRIATINIHQKLYRNTVSQSWAFPRIKKKILRYYMNSILNLMHMFIVYQAYDLIPSRTSIKVYRVKYA